MANFFKKVTSKVKQATKWVGNSVVGKAVNGTAKLLSASGIPVLSTIGAVVDKAIPDVQKVAQMVNKATEEGNINVEKVEKTIASANPDATTTEIKEATKAVVNQLDKLTPTNVTVNDANSITKISPVEKVINFFRNNKIALLFPVAIVIYLFNQPKKAKKSSRYGR